MQKLFKVQNPCFDKNLEAHWNLDILIKKTLDTLFQILNLSFASFIIISPFQEPLTNLKFKKNNSTIEWRVSLEVSFVDFSHLKNHCASYDFTKLAAY